MIIDKVRFADELSQHIVTVDGNKVIVHCIGYNTLEIEALPDEDIQVLRKRVHELIKGTPCGIDDVQVLIELAL